MEIESIADHLNLEGHYKRVDVPQPQYITPENQILKGLSSYAKPYESKGCETGRGLTVMRNGNITQFVN